ncbi:acyl-CoA dehydrogenase family protein [Rothia uropygialis]|uniref:acyl-CoA dehydrogenase family protein n=1 Tax=Kocuria sp. 36 TaxID=1415402 RepID=UPI00101BC5CF|nr:acyl-CoA dehydrogenase family protein [Kocuria sp. 36]
MSKPANTTSDFLDYASLLSEQEQTELEGIRRYLATEIKPLAEQAWDAGQFPQGLFQKLSPLGVAEGRYPEYSTVPAQPRSELLAGFIRIEMNKTDPSFAVAAGVHTGLAMGSIAGGGNEEQRQRWLPDMVAMSSIGAFALTEPEGGSDVAGGMRTTASRKGNEWVLNGAKRWIGNGTFADLVVVYARDTEDDQVKAFVVEKGTEGFQAEKIQGKISLRTVENADLTLSDVRVPEANRLQNINSFRDVAKILRATRGDVAWQATGVAMRAYEVARNYATTRVQFGKPIGGFQMIQDLLVKMLSNVTAMLGMVIRMGQLAENGEDTAAQAALAKAFCTTRMRETVAWGRELFGGNGIVLEYEIAKLFSDAEAIYSFEGSREMNTLIVGKSITGLSAFA